MALPEGEDPPSRDRGEDRGAAGTVRQRGRSLLQSLLPLHVQDLHYITGGAKDLGGKVL